jgi:hypothetical protein
VVLGSEFLATDPEVRVRFLACSEDHLGGLLSFSALRTSRALILIDIVFLLLGEPQSLVRPEGLVKFTSSGLEPASFGLVA